jgi:hypothetical protein
LAGNSGSGGSSAAGGSGGSGGASGSAGSGGQGGTAGGGGTSGTETDAGVDAAGTDAPAGDDGGSVTDGGAGSDDSGFLTGAEAGDDSGTVTGPDASVDLGADTVAVADAPTTGGNCVQQIKSNGYVFGTVPACSQCKDNNVELVDVCKGMIDCLAPKWPCTGNCWNECLNTVGGSGVVSGCVTALTNAACQ